VAAVAVLVTGVVALAPAASSRDDGVGKRRFPSRDWAHALALQRDGKIVAVGRSVGGGWRFALARYTATGKLDPSFGREGKVLSNFGPAGTASAIAIQQDGELVAAGQTAVDGIHNDFVVARYTARGRLDTRFGRGGKVLTDFGSRKPTRDGAFAVAIQADGKIVAAGGSGEPTSRHFALARYTLRGKLDPSFGPGGKVLTRFGTFEFALSLAIQKRDRKIVAAGPGRGGFALVRYTTRGKLDPSFGRDGRVVTKLGSLSRAEAVAIQADGKLVAAGVAADFSDFGLVRYTASGKLDPSFGRGGKVVTNIGFRTGGDGGKYKSEDSARAVAIQPDGKLVVAGASDTHGMYGELAQDFALVRYTADGRLDPTFGDGGKVVTDFSSGVSYAEGVVIQPDGKIVAAGGGAGYFLLARYTANGKLDATFGRGGKVQTTLRRP
jgi:uncharacterized delta-60 repeat protein